jgi:hypothetical protein
MVRHGRRSITRIAGVAYPAVITIVVIATGNHYLLDAFAGIAVVLLAMAAVSTTAHLLPRRVRDMTGIEPSIPSRSDSGA